MLLKELLQLPNIRTLSLIEEAKLKRDDFNKALVLESIPDEAEYSSETDSYTLKSAALLKLCRTVVDKVLKNINNQEVR